MLEELKVYLDHHIIREEFLYKHLPDGDQKDRSPDLPQTLRLKDLIGRQSTARILCKPDFQRATWAWKPEECVSLLESVVNEQVIPSIIMWEDPEGRWYVLDGGHRISVVLAWLRDDWGDKSTNLYKGDEDLIEKINEAAASVDKLMLERKIDKFESYEAALDRMDALPKDLREYNESVGNDDAKKAAFYRRVISGSIGFPLQWVRGDYKKAEDSFLKINSSGRSLTEWEIKLVENRNSSFARVVMSVANVTRSEHCWPYKISGEQSKTKAQENIDKILDRVNKLYKVLYEPPADPTFTMIQQPLFAEPKKEPDKKPVYLAELLTIIKGDKGQKLQTERILQLDKGLSDTQIIENGLKLLEKSLNILSHLVGYSPQSLSLVPALYFYSEKGKYIRGLLYGFIYWLFANNDEQATLNRKLLFSVYRAPFEQVFMATKKEIVRNFDRNVGSGAEVTLQVSKFFESILSLIIKHSGDIKSEVFVQDYESILKKTSIEHVPIDTLPYSKLPRCSVCNGLIDVEGNKNYEFGFEAEKGIDEKKTTFVHPFCESNYEMIKSITNGELIVELNSPRSQKPAIKPQQLEFLDFD